ncbi:putative J domain-containing protein C63.13 [Pseudocercospora fuligena]|uniref:Putative J domain-containing protein C63.13 n=1 Tax=Pseudocercospora fuligena TaxID=685502 RepID=A0A8H6RBX7_9PEZI|nr:putative J domain-containing protein C63.13 [Pseudocercospora fuligena]
MRRNDVTRFAHVKTYSFLPCNTRHNDPRTSIHEVLCSVLSFYQSSRSFGLSYPKKLSIMSDTAPPVDYYAALEVDSKATQQQIRDAYKKQALRHHPDRVPANSPDRQSRTKKFQQINDAYYTLSDPNRRKDYDLTRNQFHGFPSSSAPDPAEEEIPRPQAGSFPWSAFGFGGSAKTEDDANRYSNEQFGSVFEEMMRDEGMADSNNSPTKVFWSIVGGVSGGAMGFIVANVPGALAGAVAGNRLGAIRDKRGKSVYSVFQELDQPEKMRLLSELAQKVFAHAIS